MSNKYVLTKSNVEKVTKGAAIAVTGAAIVALSEGLLAFDYGVWTPAVYALVPILVNIARKWVSNE